VGNDGYMVVRYKSYTNSRTSVTRPVTAAAAAMSGLAKNVRAPGPWRPSKLRFEVLTLYLPVGTLSSFIPKQAEQPGPRSSKPAASNMSTNPSASAWRATWFEPGTIQTCTPSAFCLPFTKSATTLRSSMRALVRQRLVVAQLLFFRYFV
jgi:hypothetical protein